MQKMIVLLLVLTLAAVPAASLAQSNPPTIAVIVQEDEEFSTLHELLELADLVETLDGEGPFTVFVPTNDAFEALPPGMLAGVKSSPPSLRGVLTYHVAEGVLLAEDIAAMPVVPTLLGAPLTVSVDDGEVLLNGTVKVTLTDIRAANGVIHVIDAVLVPERPGSAAPAEAAEESDEDAYTLVDLVAETENLSFFATALGLSELATEALKDTEESYTLFAPSDDAFRALDSDTRMAAVTDPNRLTAVLAYHAIPGQAVPSAMAIALLGGLEEPFEVETALPGATITLFLDEDGNIVINDEILVIEVDLEADNGVIHVIDGVLLPPNDAVEAFIAELEAMQAEEGTEDAAGSSMEEGPALDPNWAAVAGGFKMAELDTADDFFVTVIDPFATGDDAELYGIEIINWTADYQYTGFIVAQFLPAEVLIWMAEQDPTIWETISDGVLAKLPAEELAKLPEDVQARAK